MIKAYLLASLTLVDGVPHTRYLVSFQQPHELATQSIGFWIIASAEGLDRRHAELALRELLEAHPVTAALGRHWLNKQDEDKWDVVRKAIRKCAEKLEKRFGKKNGLTTSESSEEA